MNKMYGVIDYQKETKGFLSFSDFTGTHGKHKARKASNKSKSATASRLVINEEGLSKPEFAKKLKHMAKNISKNGGKVAFIGYFK